MQTQNYGFQQQTYYRLRHEAVLNILKKHNERTVYKQNIRQVQKQTSFKEVNNRFKQKLKSKKFSLNSKNIQEQQVNKGNGLKDQKKIYTKKELPVLQTNIIDESENITLKDIFNREAYQDIKFDIPWDGKTVVNGFIVWGLSFFICTVAPYTFQIFGLVNFQKLSSQDEGLILLLIQSTSTVFGIVMVNLFLKKYQPYPKDTLSVSFDKPLKGKQAWLVWVLIGIVTLVAVQFISSYLLTSIQYDKIGGRTTTEEVIKLIEVNYVQAASIFGTTGVGAPILEEFIFRGFLLGSLTKFQNTFSSVLLSSLVFAGFHLSLKDLPQLILMGMIVGYSYVRSKNLLTPIVIHGIWNSGILFFLFLMKFLGKDLSQL